MNKFFASVVALFIVAAMFVTFVPAGRRMINRYDASLQKADEVRYETKQEVEAYARATIANYHTAVDQYEAFKDSEVPQERAWAMEAMMTANRTVHIFNDYMLENSYVWKDNIPPDINVKLEPIKPD